MPVIQGERAASQGGKKRLLLRDDALPVALHVGQECARYGRHSRWRSRVRLRQREGGRHRGRKLRLLPEGAFQRRRGSDVGTDDQVLVELRQDWVRAELTKLHSNDSIGHKCGNEGIFSMYICFVFYMTEISCLGSWCFPWPVSQLLVHVALVIDFKRESSK